jgi:outer membrane protein
LGVGLFPKYAGSKDYSALPLPLVTVRSKNFYWIGLEGGYAYPLNNMFSIGPLVSLERGRDQDDAGRLRGLGDIDTTMGYGAFVNGRFGGLNVTLKYVQSTKSAYGGRVGLDAFYMWRLGQQDRLTLSASTIWGNNKYMQTNFGVTEAQAATSEAGLQTYNANSGFQHVRVGTTWVHAFNPNWSMLTMVGATSLVGKTKDSPVVEKTTSLYSTVGVIYSF